MDNMQMSYYKSLRLRICAKSVFFCKKRPFHSVLVGLRASFCSQNAFIKLSVNTCLQCKPFLTTHKI